MLDKDLADALSDLSDTRSSPDDFRCDEVEASAFLGKSERVLEDLHEQKYKMPGLGKQPFRWYLPGLQIYRDSLLLRNGISSAGVWGPA